VGSEHDPLEHEADRTAERILSPSFTPSTLSRTPSNQDADPGTVRELLGGPGHALDSASRAFFEPRFASDLSAVRVHSGPAAFTAASRVSARAFTLGNHIAFAPGEYAPHGPAGRRLLAHELAHVTQQARTTATVIRRRALEAFEQPASPSSRKDQIIAITAEYGAHVGVAHLAHDAQTVPVSITENKMPIGTWYLHQQHDGAYAWDRSIDPSLRHLAFRWVNPYISKQIKETYYDWAPTVEITITPRSGASVSERIDALPPQIRRLFVSDRYGPQASDEDLEAIADAGELIVSSGVSPEEITLVADSMGGQNARQETNDPLAFARVLTAEHQRRQQLAERSRSDLLGIARLLGKEPLELVRLGGLASWLDGSAWKVDIQHGLSLLKHYRITGQKDRSTARRVNDLLALLESFRSLIGRFEVALLADLRLRANAGLDSLEAAILKMNKTYVGMGLESAPSSHNLWSELERIRNDPTVQVAAAYRDLARHDIDEAQQDDVKLTFQVGGIAPGLFQKKDFDKRQQQREQQRALATRAFAAAVSRNSDISVPPDGDVEALLAETDADRAVTLLAAYLTRGAQHVSDARQNISDDRFVYAAEIWISEEANSLKSDLGGDLGAEIAALVGMLAQFRRSETSIWEDVLHLAQFLANFVPGPLGWALRAGSAALEFGRTMGKLGDQSTLHAVGGSAQAVQGGDALGALVDLALGALPDASVAGEARTGSGIGRELESDATRQLESGSGRKALEPGGAEAPAAQAATNDLPPTNPPAPEVKPPEPSASPVHEPGPSAPAEPIHTEPRTGEEAATPTQEATAPQQEKPSYAESTAQRSDEVPTAERQKPEPSRDKSAEHGSSEQPPPREVDPETAAGATAHAPPSLEQLNSRAEKLREEVGRLRGKAKSTESAVVKLQSDFEKGNAKRPLSETGIQAHEARLEKLEEEAAVLLDEADAAQAELEAAEREIERLTPQPELDPRDWRKSERDVEHHFPDEFYRHDKKSYILGKVVRFGKKGSVRPDFVAKDGRLAIDVKNYNIATNKWGLIDNVTGQAKQRLPHLPPGMKQGVLIDIRGQEVTQETLNQIEQEIVKRSDNLISEDNIIFLKDDFPTHTK
jgi:hypothetical protein